MTAEELTKQVEYLESLITAGNDYIAAEVQARELLVLIEGRARSEGDFAVRCRLLLALSQSLWRRGLAKDALPYAEEALTLAEELHHKGFVVKALDNIGSIYGNLSDYPKALELYSRALALNEELGNKKGVSSTTGNMGIAYMHLSDYPKALEYYSRALALDEELGNKSGMARHISNIGGYIYISQTI